MMERIPQDNVASLGQLSDFDGTHFCFIEQDFKLLFIMCVDTIFRRRIQAIKSISISNIQVNVQFLGKFHDAKGSAVWL